MNTNKKRQSYYFPPLIQLLQCALQGQPDTHRVTEPVFVICNLTPSFNLSPIYSSLTSQVAQW